MTIIFKILFKYTPPMLNTIPIKGFSLYCNVTSRKAFNAIPIKGF